MNSTAALILFGMEQLLKHAPTLFLEVRRIINKKSVTAEDLRAKREEIAADTYGKLVPNSKLK